MYWFQITLVVATLLLWADLFLFLIFASPEDPLWKNCLPGAGFWYAGRFALARYLSRA